MDAEITAIERNDTWELCDIPKGQKTIGVKWVYKTKLKENGEVDKHKARLVAKGYKHEFGVDYKEVFALVARHDTYNQIGDCDGNSKLMAYLLVGCEISIPPWRFEGRGIYRSTFCLCKTWQ